MFGAGGSSGFTFGATTTTQPQQTTVPPASGFTFGATAPGISGQATAAPSASTGFQGFNFSASQPSLFGQTGGLTTGTPATVVAPAASGFTFGANPATVGNLGGAQPSTTPVVTPGGGFTFGTPAGIPAAQPTVNPTLPTLNALTKPAPAATATVFPFGSTPAGTAPVSQPAPAQIQLGTIAPTAAPGGFSFGGVAPSTANSGFGFSVPKTTQAVAPVATTAATAPALSFGTAAAATTQPSAGFTLSGGFKLGGSPAVTTTTSAAVAPVSGFSIGSGVASTGGGLKLGATNLLTTTPSTSTEAPKPVLSTLLSGGSGSTGTSLFGASAATTLPATTVVPAAASSIGAPAATTTTTLTTTTTPSTQMNYRQLEEAINKWSLELEEHEKIFLQQATQVNAWDRMLIENGEKITELNNDVERVKLDQQRLDHELDFIRAQQRELEELLSPLEKGVEQMPAISYQQHADLEREHTYQLSENIDAQLKRMVQDLKEIIEHVNSSSANQDSNDPILQITKILNAHMDSLQWIDQNGAMLNRRVDELSKQMDTQRKEQERSFRLTYD